MNSTSSYEKPAEYKLRQLLKELRISATIHQIPEWSQNEEFMQNGAILRQFTNSFDNESFGLMEDNINQSKLYMQR